MMRKFLCGVLFVVVAFSVIGVSDITALAAENVMAYEWEVTEVEMEEEFSNTYTSGVFQYVLNEDGTATIVGCTDYEAETISIPSVIDSYTVTGVGSNSSSNFFAHNSSVKSMSIPAGVNSINFMWLGNSYDITEFVIDSSNEYYKSVDGVIFSKDGRRIVSFPRGKETAVYEIPEGVIIIEDNCFKSCRKVDKVILAESVDTVGVNAFRSCELKEIVLGKNVTIIRNGAFAYSNYLEEIVIPDSVTEIGNSAFVSSDIKRLVIGKNVKTIGDMAFCYCDNLVEVTIPASVEKIGSKAFTYNESLVEIKVEEGSEYYKIGDGALITKDGKTLLTYPPARTATSHTVPDGVVVIYMDAFWHARNLEQITLPYGLLTISSEAFLGCSNLKELELPHTVNTIGSYTFVGCESMEKFSFSAKIEAVYGGIFSGCTGLKSIFFPSEITYIGDDVFESDIPLQEIHYVGSQEEWNNISIGAEGNEGLSGVKIHYLGNLKDFVARMYTVALGREYDAVGLNGWVQMLVHETHDGAGLANEFVLGEEFALRNLTDEECVDTLYATFFNREADAAGKELWIATLASGASREYVLSQFVNLDEFTLLCADYEINRGVMFEDGSVAPPGLPQFVARLYGQVLGRASDASGLYNWTKALHVKAVTAEAAAVNFFASEEYQLKNTDSTTFVTELYSVFMDREADAEGLAFWVSCLEEQGVSREWVIAEFAKSAEFKDIAAKYGL